MPNKRRTSGARSAPKLFKCTGYGDCDMVFTRSEHLARHERKHTGEKPYKCVVPGCNRMFSRFDNMMQHTQTHEKNKKPVPSSLVQSTKRMSRGNPTLLKPEAMPDPLEGSSMVNSRTLPLPTRRASISTPYNTNPYPISYPHPPPPPPPYGYPLSPQQHVWPLKRNHYPSYYDQHLARRRSSTSTLSVESPLISPVSCSFPQPKEPQVRRRISIDDLRLPIEDLKENKTKPVYDKQAVDITSDEYEALEGFSKFHSTVVAPTGKSADTQDYPRTHFSRIHAITKNEEYKPKLSFRSMRYASTRHGRE
ncbi:uncharacterized protein B0P05DRAFT_62532 [Gilbertella persicaria]|uniref:uncharacterized protein n=1 Tax=Gilbertella persicaria TaxID=101096 RepID=UPI00221FA521|nr:uncharacterized protein B0P05DRAFT_62532 [Gilbertella persicaria]KAI8081815.1 hypothetical protein B0P05DRAFT_62532 [Gilbertella persicaria]